MELFVAQDSIVRKIWGKSDTVLFIFAGASAEFALNKAVDWLYYTGKLPSDPLGRLFSTVSYARKIVFSSAEQANESIDFIAHIHNSVEKSRGIAIPDWAYRDVLFMLIYFSIASYELLERKLTDLEKEEVYNVFYRVGLRMGLKELPINYMDWLPVRDAHLKENLEKSNFTIDLFKQYKKHLGTIRFNLLVGVQKLIVPKIAKDKLFKNNFSLLKPIVKIYKISKVLKMDSVIKELLLPSEYKSQIKEIDIQ
ncbi:oxygenase MpaB family protein [Flavobacterium soli]|uniref:oxygenase MpaB family protein n=1 Tax=Flavobacterium soli TaxID=344881 RepID=UPI000413AF87|nr:oxygenase MpaB family protein [Flavobacterium soli]